MEEERLPLATAIAKWAYEAQRPCELSLQGGYCLKILEHRDSGWWLARAANGAVGEVPRTFLHEMDEVDGEGECSDDQESAYFHEYGRNVNVHHQMLKDQPRCDAYLAALRMHADKVRGGVVMDVGAGTGILSLFAAALGARRVYAVEASDLGRETLPRIVQRNGFDDVIRVIHKRAEHIVREDLSFSGDATDADEACVDVLMSEWMGTCLVFESMAPAVFHCRDRYLKPDGVLLPDTATIFAVPVDASRLWDERMSFWRTVSEFAFDLSDMQDLERTSSFAAPVMSHTVTEEDLLAEPELVCGPFDLYAATAADIEIREPREHHWQATMRRAGSFHGCVVYFDVAFHRVRSGSPPILPLLKDAQAPPPIEDANAEPIDAVDRVDALETALGALAARLEAGGPPQNRETPSQVVLSTSPAAPATHWKHPLCVFDEAVPVSAGSTMTLAFGLRRHPQLVRHYRLSLAAESQGQVRAKDFALWEA